MAKNTKELIVKQLVKKGYTEKEAEFAIANTKLSDETLFSLLQEAKNEEEKIESVEITKIPSLLKKGFELSINIQDLSVKKQNKLTSKWAEEFSEKNFNNVYKATLEFNKELDKKKESLTNDEVVLNFVKNGGDIEEKKLEDALALHKYRKLLLPQVDEKFKVTKELREEYVKQINVKYQSIEKHYDDKIQPIQSELEIIQQTIAKTLFISLEEANLMIANKNFFDVFFNTLEATANKYEEVYRHLKTFIKVSYESKQEEMQNRLKEIRKEKLAN